MCARPANRHTLAPKTGLIPLADRRVYRAPDMDTTQNFTIWARS